MGHAKFEVKDFSEFFCLQSALDSEFFRGVSGHQRFLVTLNLRSKIFRNFFVYRVLWTEFFRGGDWRPTFFGHAKFEVKYFSEIFRLQSTMELNCLGEGIWALTLFGHAELEVKIFLFTEHSGL